MLFFFFLSTLALADDKIVVTATREASDVADLPFSVGAVSGDRWRSSGGDPEAALAAIPGLSFTANGAPGQPRTLRIRGANAEHTLVLVDGIPVNDPLLPSRSFDFGQIPVNEIDHVEVLKGPESVLYGSDALGGVVQIFTKKGKETNARAEAGSYGTFRADLATMGFRAGYFSTKGFSAADSRQGNREADGSRSWNLGGTKDFPLNDSFLMRLTAQYQSSRTDTDRSGGPGGDSYNTYADHDQFLLREENVLFLPEDTELSIAGDYSSHDRTDNTNGRDFYKSQAWKAEAIARRPWGPQKLTLGAEYANEGGTSSQITGRHDFHTESVYAQDEAKLTERLNLVGGSRIDFHSQTDSATTFRAGLSYWLVKDLLRAKASIGSGFKAPSLYQTYSSFGSLTLKPEKSLGGDFGLEAHSGDWATDLTFYGNRFRDLIDFDSIANRFFNQSRAETSGFEWSLERRAGFWRFENALTLLRAFDPATGTLLPRRPRWSDTITTGFGRAKRWEANLHWRYVGERIDSSFTQQKMPAYYVLSADFYHELGNGLRFIARGDNLLDRRYQEAAGYGTPGLSGYAGIEADLP